MNIRGDILLQNKMYMEHLEIIEEIELDELFNKLFLWLYKSSHESKNSNNFGTCIHFSSNCFDLLNLDWFQEAYFDALGKFNLKHELEVIFHIPFNDEQLPLNKDFIPTLLKQLNLCKKINSNTIVIHAPRTYDDTSQPFIEEMSSEVVRKAMGETDINICIENAQDSGTYFSSLQHLIELREQLVKNYADLGDQHLSKNIQFCFDTGHYLLYQQRDGHEDDEWKQYGNTFLQHVGVFHIHSNDGSMDQHLLPYTKADLPESKYPFDFKYFFENGHQVLKWIKQSHDQWAVQKRHMVLEIDPYFTNEELKKFWNMLVEDMNQ
jgi:sugar phosphate isomerase/epimerase